MKKALREFPDWAYLISGVAILVSIMAIIGMVKGPADNNKTSFEMHDVTVTAQLETMNSKKKLVYLNHEESNKYNRSSVENAMCIVKDFKEYPINKKIKDFECKYNKNLKNEQLKVIDQIAEGLGE